MTIEVSSLWRKIRVGDSFSGQFFVTKDGRVFYTGPSKGAKRPNVCVVCEDKSIYVPGTDPIDAGLSVGEVVQLISAPHIGIRCMKEARFVDAQPNSKLKVA